MNPQDWERVKDIFASAIQLLPAERSRYVWVECGKNIEIHQAVLELITNHEEAQEFLQEGERETLPPVFAAGDIVAARFRITRFISRGGMGEVYEAYDQRLRLRVALKTLRSDLAKDSGALQRFWREICVAREVGHDAICRVFDLVEHAVSPASEGEPATSIACLTMQLLEGESLQLYIQRHRPLNLEKALDLLRPIAEALDALHKHGIIHRDLKPSNIMLVPRDDGSFRVVVMDFGLSKPLIDDRGWFESRADQQAGAPYFVAPEQLRGEKLDASSDIYAFGLLIDEMVTRSRAFASDSVHGLFYQKLWEKPLSPSERADGLPANWDAAILQCLDGDREKRPKHARDVIAALMAPMDIKVDSKPDVLSRSMPDVPLEPPLSQAASSWRTPRRLVFTLVALLLVIAVAQLAKSAARPIPASIGVFEIANLTGRTDVDYLSKGTTNELLRELSLRQNIRVLPYRQQRRAESKVIATARFALDGQMQMEQNRVRLTFQVTDDSGALVWADSFTRHMEGTLDLQSEVAARTIEAIEKKALSEQPGGSLFATVLLPLRRSLGFQVSPAASPPTRSSVAWNLYMRGRHLWDERTLEGTIAAIHCFEQALADDPKFGLAYAALADTQLTLMEHRYAPPIQLLEKGRAYAEKAIAESPEFPEGHVARAAVLQQFWDWPQAEASFQKAIQLNPKFPRAHRWYGGMIIQFGRFDEGLKEAKTSLELDPFDYPAHSAYGLYLFYAGRYKDAETHLTNTLSHKDLIYAHAILGDVYARLGQIGPAGGSRYILSQSAGASESGGSQGTEG